MASKYKMLYIQRSITKDDNIHLDAYDLEHRMIAVGTEMLTDLLDELYELREEINEWKGSKKAQTDGPAHSDRPDEGQGK
jgi:hypothetical protein